MSFFSWLRALFGGRRRPSPAPPPTPAPDSARGRLTKIVGPFHPRLYSYWANAVIRDGAIYVFGGHVNNGPMLYTVKDGRLTSVSSLPWGLSGTTEGFYLDSKGWLYFTDGPRLMHGDPLRPEPPKVAMDISTAFSNCRVWQTHSNDAGDVHSATVQSTEDWRYVSTVVSRQGLLLAFGPIHGRIDESQVDASGNWLLIKEVDNDGKLHNRIIHLYTLDETHLEPHQRIGHSDNGHGFILGEDSTLGAAVKMDCATLDRRMLFQSWNMGHVSVRGNQALFSRHELGRLELMNLDTREMRIVLEHGVTTNDYDQQVRANLSPCGKLAAFTWNGDLCVLEL